MCLCSLYTDYMHIYFSGIGGTGIGPLALIAHQAGYQVSGSDKQDSDYIAYSRSQGLENIHIGQTAEAIQAVHDQQPIDWIVYSSSVHMESPDHPELQFAQANGIRCTKRDEFLSELLQQTGQKMIAIAGTHGKTTTTAMTVWALQQLGVVASHLLPAKTSFTDMGHFNPQAEYFVYEADEYDRNFLSYTPALSMIAGIAYDHPDIYPTPDEYHSAFREFINRSEHTSIWKSDAQRISVDSSEKVLVVADDNDLSSFSLAGEVNRRNAFLLATTLEYQLGLDKSELVEVLNRFPGVQRRFEQIAPNIYSDYAHTPEKIQGAIQLAREVATNKLVIIYEGLHNTRQHFIRDQLTNLFAGANELIIVPSYRAREDESLEDLTPAKLVEITQQPTTRTPAVLDESLKQTIQQHADAGDLVLCLTAGGGNSLDEWLRKEFA